MRLPVAALALLLACISCANSSGGDGLVVYEAFDQGWESRWIHSKQPTYEGKFKSVQATSWDDEGIEIPEASKHYGLTRMLDTPLDPSKGLVLQYEVRTTKGVTCGGAYIKLLTESPSLDASALDSTTPYTIMFGPDKCGATGKVHLIFRHQNPKTGDVEEHHLASPPAPLTDTAFTHLYSVQLLPNNKFEMWIDGEKKASGSLLEEGTFEPPFNPPTEIPDPTDHKPEDWVDVAMIPDPDAVKPVDWADLAELPDEDAVKPEGWEDDEPGAIPDPAAKKPEDWDEEEDGEWSAPLIINPKCKVGCGTWVRPTKKNPAYKGPWKAPVIDNPDYKGEWVQKKIPNPDYYEDKEPLKHIGNIGAVALELWTIDSGYTFDNILLAQDPSAARHAMESLWKPRRAAETAAREKDVMKQDMSKPDGPASKDLAYWITWLFTETQLKPLRPWVQEYLDQIERTPWVANFTVGLPLLCMLAAAFLARPRNKRKAERDALRKAARQQAATQQAAAAEGEEEEEEAEEQEQTGTAAADVAGPAATAAAGEIAPEPEEEVPAANGNAEAPADSKPRKRTSRRA